MHTATFDNEGNRTDRHTAFAVPAQRAGNEARMFMYTLTFKGYAGVPDKTVSVPAADYWQAERVARMQNPGWHDVCDVRREDLYMEVREADGYAGPSFVRWFFSQAEEARRVFENTPLPVGRTRWLVELDGTPYGKVWSSRSR